MPTTRSQPEAEGRLFPAEEIAGWQISAQADYAGYSCKPRETLPHLEDYEEVEVKLGAPHGLPVDPTTLGLPPEIVAKFRRLSDDDGLHLGHNITQAELRQIRIAVMRAAARDPHAGVPRGIYGWQHQHVFHATSSENGKAILEIGIDQACWHDGPSGRAFYVGADDMTARMLQSRFSDDVAATAVAKFAIKLSGRILDLRNAEDRAAFKASGLDQRQDDPAISAHAIRQGIDGIFDPRQGSLAIFNPTVLSLIGVSHDAEVEAQDEPDDEDPTP